MVLVFVLMFPTCLVDFRYGTLDDIVRCCCYSLCCCCCSQKLVWKFTAANFALGLGNMHLTKSLANEQKRLQVVFSFTLTEIYIFPYD